MSGGHFDYAQYRIDDIIYSIQRAIDDAKKPRPPLITKSGVSVLEKMEEGYYRHVNHHFVDFGDALYYYTNNDRYEILDRNDKMLWVKDKHTEQVYKIKHFTYEEYEDGKYYPDYSDETIKEFENAIDILCKASVYVHRIDWFLSGDDGEESFHLRLKEELDKLKKRRKRK